MKEQVIMVKIFIPDDGQDKELSEILKENNYAALLEYARKKLEQSGVRVEKIGY